MENRARKLLARTPVAKPGQNWFRMEAVSDETTEVMIYDEIGFWGTDAAEFVNQFAAIKTPKILLRLNSPGGEIFDGVAIYNAIKAHPSYVTVRVDGLAASAASFIAMAGNEVLMTRNGTMMIHDGLGFTYGNAKDHQETASLLDKLSDNIAEIYARKTGGELATWRDFMREEVWYSSQEAVDAGLADRVVDLGEDEEDDTKGAKNQFALLDAFKHSGREEAPDPEDIRRRVINRVKEARMSTPKTPRNEGQQPEGQEAPDVESTSPDGSQPAEPVTVNPVPGEAPDAESAPPAETPSPEGTPPANRAGAQTVFMVNGQPTTDFTAVQQYINVLEASAKENKDANRKEFVQNLARTNRITAAQITATEELALDLNDTQYEKWVASWEAAPSHGLLGTHAAGGSSQPAPAEKAAQDKIEQATAIVKQHKLSGMSADKIMQTDSYKVLVADNPDYKL